MSNPCTCWIVHVTDPEERNRIERQIVIEKGHANRGTKAKKHADAAIAILEAQLQPCPKATPQPKDNE